MSLEATRERYSAALDRLIEGIRQDRSIVAALLCGSLSYDIVWTKSDIDLVLVTIDDKNVEESEVSLYADGVNVHAMLVPRRRFRQIVDGSLRHSVIHAFLARGRLLYTHDQTLIPLCATLADLGSRDNELQLLRAAIAALPAIDKAHKWFVTGRDLEYTALWLLAAAKPLAHVEVIAAGRLAEREVLLQAVALNPTFFSVIYTDLLNGPKTRDGVWRALEAVDEYLAARIPTLFRPVLNHLREAGEARSCREIDDYFARTFDIDGTVTACEYLADRGVLGKVSIAGRLTKRSNVQVEELAFFHIDPVNG